VTDMHVLLVDDERDFLEIVSKRLRKRQVTLEGVTSGEAALRAIAETPIDVVVLDMRMPGMDGLQTLRAIKRARPDIEVIMLTGHADVEAAVEGMQLGAFDYLMKPIDIDALLYRLQDAYKKKTLAATSQGGA
jgi:DNA-binding NtrC family response regulator